MVFEVDRNRITAIVGPMRFNPSISMYLWKCTVYGMTVGGYLGFASALIAPPALGMFIVKKLLKR